MILTFKSKQSTGGITENPKKIALFSGVLDALCPSFPNEGLFLRRLLTTTQTIRVVF
jgi:hypothetical protein